MRYRWMPLVLTLCCAAPALGVTPRLVKDINPVPTGEGSDPEFHLSSGSFALAYLVANDGETGRELWRTDGTEAGTFQVLDACPGECSGNPFAFGRSGDLFFFSASDATGRQSLWATRGTPATTFRVLEEPAQRAPRRSVWIARAGALFFPVTDPDHGLELWRSDGTPTGTFPVMDLRPGPASSDPDELTEFNGRLFFRADDGRGSSLWTSDGTAQGTRLVRDPVPTTASHAGPAFLRAASKNLFFTAPPPRGGVAQLWTSDGTTRGTMTLTSLKPGASTNTIPDVTVLGSRLFFIAETKDGQELWASNGTPQGTRALTNFNLTKPIVFSFSGRGPAFPRSALSDRIFFHASDGVNGVGLWTSDGTPGGTRLVKDLVPLYSSSPRKLMEHAGRLWFFADSPEGDYAAFWSTDGTAAGTRREADLVPRPESFQPDWIISAGSKLFLSGGDTGLGLGLWVYDGTGARRISDAVISNPLGQATPVVLGDNLYYSGFVSGGSRGLWKSDGTEAGTVQLLSEAGAPLEFPQSFQVFDGRVFFHDLGRLMVTDGNAVQLVLDNVAAELLILGGRLFFRHHDPATGSELWVLE